MPEPIFTIIIPTNNSAKVIGAALGSILSQNFDSFEILLMDNKSTDGTTVLAAAFNDKRIRIISETDRGVYDAMNKGIAAARGQWLLFLGSDDALYDINVLRAVKEALFEQLDVLYGDVVLKSSKLLYGGQFDLARLLFKQNICHQSIFYNKTIFDRIGFYNLSYKIWADWDLNIRCFRHTEFRIVYSNVVVAVYNDRAGVSRTPDPVFYQELPMFYKHKYDALAKKLSNLSVIDAVRYCWGGYKRKLKKRLGL
jgi:glycosyltransferase involved in cell wall biosynthesis